MTYTDIEALERLKELRQENERLKAEMAAIKEAAVNVLLRHDGNTSELAALEEIVGNELQEAIYWETQQSHYFDNI